MSECTAHHLEPDWLEGNICQKPWNKANKACGKIINEIVQWRDGWGLTGHLMVLRNHCESFSVTTGLWWCLIKECLPFRKNILKYLSMESQSLWVASQYCRGKDSRWDLGWDTWATSWCWLSLMMGTWGFIVLLPLLLWMLGAFQNKK